MKILVGYNETGVSKAALALAREHAERFNAKVYLMTSMEGGSGETTKDIERVEKSLKEAGEYLAEKGVDYEVHQLARGMTPGEDIVRFAQDNGMDLVYVGVKKKSKAQKILLGSTAQFIILKAPCPVITVK